MLHGNRGEHLAENDDLVVGGDFVRKALGIVDADVERAVNERLDAAKFLRFADLDEVDAGAMSSDSCVKSESLLASVPKVRLALSAVSDRPIVSEDSGRGRMTTSSRPEACSP